MEEIRTWELHIYKLLHGPFTVPYRTQTPLQIFAKSIHLSLLDLSAVIKIIIQGGVAGCPVA